MSHNRFASPGCVQVPLIAIYLTVFLMPVDSV